MKIRQIQAAADRSRIVSCCASRPIPGGNQGSSSPGASSGNSLAPPDGAAAGPSQACPGNVSGEEPGSFGEPLSQRRSRASPRLDALLPSEAKLEPAGPGRCKITLREPRERSFYWRSTPTASRPCAPCCAPEPIPPAGTSICLTGVPVRPKMPGPARPSSTDMPVALGLRIAGGRPDQGDASRARTRPTRNRAGRHPILRRLRRVYHSAAGGPAAGAPCLSRRERPPHPLAGAKGVSSSWKPAFAWDSTFSPLGQPGRRTLSATSACILSPPRSTLSVPRTCALPRPPGRNSPPGRSAARTLAALVPSFHRLNLAGGRVILTLVFGDAVEVLRARSMPPWMPFTWTAFSPAKNPNCGLPLLRTLARLCRPGRDPGELVRQQRRPRRPRRRRIRPGKAPGFRRQAAYAGSAVTRSRKPAKETNPSDRRALVLGAGLAGATTAHGLARRGWQVTVLDENGAPGLGASGNLAGVLRPLPSVDDNRLARLTRAGYPATRALIDDLGGAVRWSPCGVMHLARDASHGTIQRRTVETFASARRIPSGFSTVKRPPNSLGPPTQAAGGFRGAAGVHPILCGAALAAFPERIATRFGCAVARLERADGEWRAFGANDGTRVAAALSGDRGGAAATRLNLLTHLPQHRARGPGDHLPAEPGRPGGGRLPASVMPPRRWTASSWRGELYPLGRRATANGSATMPTTPAGTDVAGLRR